MKITRIDPTHAAPNPATAKNFAGDVTFQTIVGSAESDELDMLSVRFNAGARTRPHVHHQDQVLHIIEGTGIVADDTAKQVVSAGDVITIPKGSWHWHGATRTTAMTHLSIMERGQTDWTVEEKNWAAGYDD